MPKGKAKPMPYRGEEAVPSSPIDKFLAPFEFLTPPEPPEPPGPEVHAPDGITLYATTISDTMHPVLAASPYGHDGLLEYQNANCSASWALYLPYILVEMQRLVMLNDPKNFIGFIPALTVEIFQEFTHHQVVQTPKYMKHLAAIDQEGDPAVMVASDLDHWCAFTSLLSIIRTHSTSLALGGHEIGRWSLVAAAVSALNNELAVLVADALCEALDLGLSRRFNTTGHASTVAPAPGQLPRLTPAMLTFSTNRWTAPAARWPRAATAPRHWIQFWMQPDQGPKALMDVCERRRFLSKNPKQVLWDASKRALNLSLPQKVTLTGSRKRLARADVCQRVLNDVLNLRNHPEETTSLASVMCTVSASATAYLKELGGDGCAHHAAAPVILQRTAAAAATFLVEMGVNVPNELHNAGKELEQSQSIASRKRTITRGEHAALTHAYDRLSPNDQGFKADRDEANLDMWRRAGSAGGHFCLFEDIEIPHVKTGKAERVGDWIHYELRLNSPSTPDVPKDFPFTDMFLRSPVKCTSITQMLSIVWSDVMIGHYLDVGHDKASLLKKEECQKGNASVLLQLTPEQSRAWARVEWACGAKLLATARCDEPSMNGPLVRSIAERFHSQLHFADEKVRRPPLIAVSVAADTEVLVCDYDHSEVQGESAAAAERETRDISDAHYERVCSFLGLAKGLGDDFRNLRVGSVDDLRDGERIVPVLVAGSNEGIWIDASDKFSGWSIEVRLKYAVVVKNGALRLGCGHDSRSTIELEAKRQAWRANLVRTFKRVVAIVLLLKRWRFSAPLQSSYRTVVKAYQPPVPAAIRQCVHKAIERAVAMAECRRLEAKRKEAEAQEAAARARLEKELSHALVRRVLDGIVREAALVEHRAHMALLEAETAARAVTVARVRKLNLESYQKFALKAKEREREAKEAARGEAAAARAAEREAKAQAATEAKAKAAADHQAQVAARRAQRDKEKAQRKAAEQAQRKAAEEAERARTEAEAERARAERERERAAALAREQAVREFNENARAEAAAAAAAMEAVAAEQARRAAEEQAAAKVAAAEKAAAERLTEEEERQRREEQSRAARAGDPNHLCLDGEGLDAATRASREAIRTGQKAIDVHYRMMCAGEVAYDESVDRRWKQSQHDRERERLARKERAAEAERRAEHQEQQSRLECEIVAGRERELQRREQEDIARAARESAQAARESAQAARESRVAEHAERMGQDKPRRDACLRKLAAMELDCCAVQRAQERMPKFARTNGWFGAHRLLWRACAAARHAEDARLNMPPDATPAARKALWEAVVHTNDAAVAEHKKIKGIAKAEQEHQDNERRKAQLEAEAAEAAEAAAREHAAVQGRAQQEEEEDRAFAAAVDSAKTHNEQCCRRLQQAIETMREAERAHHNAKSRPKHERDELYALVEFLRAEEEVARNEYQEATNTINNLREQHGPAALRAERRQAQAKGNAQATADLQRRLGISAPPASPGAASSSGASSSSPSPSSPSSSSPSPPPPAAPDSGTARHRLCADVERAREATKVAQRANYAASKNNRPLAERQAAFHRFHACRATEEAARKALAKSVQPVQPVQPVPLRQSPPATLPQAQVQILAPARAPAPAPPPPAAETTTHETACIICMDAPRNHAAIACGHQVVCGGCSAQLDRCPVCRCETAFLRLILS